MSEKNNENLSEKEQQELLEKYDTESKTRNLKGIIASVVFLLLIAFSIFQLYTGIFGQFTAYIQRTVHLGFALVLIFLLFPAVRGAKKDTVPWYDYVLMVLAIAVCSYWPVFYDTLVQQFGGISLMQMIIGGLAILLVLEAARRAVGLPIIIIALLFLCYALFGPICRGLLRTEDCRLNN